MIGAIGRSIGLFRGRAGDDSLVPAMDGPLSPNTRLDEGAKLACLNDIDNLLLNGDSILASSGPHLCHLTQSAGGWIAHRHAHYEAEIASLARASDGALAIGLDGTGITIEGGAFDGTRITALGGRPLSCPTALCFEGPDKLLIALGSEECTAAAWQRDLMSGGCGGSVWRFMLADGTAQPLAQGLAFPAGIAAMDDGSCLVSEAWRHRILRIGAGGERRVMLDQLPAYPGRIAAYAGRYWLALFAPRNQMVEFVLNEPGFCRRMVSEVEMEFWVAPRLSRSHDRRAPLQEGGIRKLNTLKPWSPSWSYGLVVECDASLRPIASFHSRANGAVHGVTSLAPTDGGVFVAARGSGALVWLDHAIMHEEPER